MKNLKITRMNRGQSSASGLRRRLRKKDGDIAELKAECDHLKGSIRRLQQRPTQRLNIPAGFADHTLRRFGDYLARTLAGKVVEEVPDLVQGARASARYMADLFAGSARFRSHSLDDMVYEVRESFRGDSAQFSLFLDRVSIHHGEDLMAIEMMRPMSSPFVSNADLKMPTRIHVSNKDIARSNSFSC